MAEEITIERRLTSAKLRALFQQAVAGPVGDDVVTGICRLLITMSEGRQDQADRALDLFNDRLQGRLGDNQRLLSRSLLELFCEGSVDLVGVNSEDNELLWTPSETITPEHHV